MMISSGWTYRDGVQLVWFVDEIDLLSAAQTSNALAGVVNPTLEAIDAWMEDHWLQVA